jgi:tRNA(His) guanylyltransferase
MATCQIMSRMKTNYENRNRHFLTRKVPVIIRLDGKAFHTYTRGLLKPFDEGLISDMQQTTIYLCENIQGVKCGYTQSDEISLLLTDYDTHETQSWFDYNQSKMESISASLATGIFNQLRTLRISNYSHIDLDYFKELILANFDSRSFNIPREEIANYFYARQKDAVKNSVSMLAQSLYPHKELHGKNGSEMQEMCFQKGHNYNDLHWSKKRGSFVVKNTYVTSKQRNFENKLITTIPLQELYLDDVIRNKWEVVETPMKFDDDVFRQWL